MGRHSRKDPAPAPAPAPQPYERPSERPPERPAAQSWERSWDQVHDRPPVPEERGRPWPEATVTHRGHVPEERSVPDGHPQQFEHGGAWGARPDSVYGDWRGVPRPRAATALLDTDTPAYGTPAVGFPQVTPAQPATGPARRPAAAPERDPVTSTGSHRRVPGPRKPAAAVADTVADVDVDPAPERPGSGRGLKIRTYTGMAAAAVTTVLAVVVAGQVATDGESAPHGTLSATGDGRADEAASRSDGRPVPQAPAQAPAPVPVPAPELTYEQRMAERLPIDEKLTGPGLFDTVPGVAKAPGKGRLVRYRVDVEQGLGLDAQLFAEAVHRTLNDDRSWAHGGARTFERVPGGESDFVITLASPGTTGKWCAKSGLDTTVDNVSCDSAATERVMINAFRWAQGAATFGPDQMLAYRQMLINHEVGHRLGNGHVNCRTPGALAPIMQQQTKSLDIDGVQCKPNPWVFPGS